MEERRRESVFDRHGIVAGMVGSEALPRMIRTRQKLDAAVVEDIAATVAAEMEKPTIRERIRPGMSVAVTVGSRGIANLALIVRETVRALRKIGANPFIIPAMGSHGGGSAEGQREVLEGMGVTEEYIGAPIRSSMQVVSIGALEDGRPVYIDRFASEADGIFLIGRVKPHTCFRGPYESGLFKMLAIGLGKHQGAVACHSQGFRKMAENVPLYARHMLKHAAVTGGLALIENAHDETSRIVALAADEIEEREPALLDEARGKMGRIHFEGLDILVVDEIGKNHSGDGMDPNVTGSFCTPFATGNLSVDQYVVLDLSPESHGNAIGLGMAHYTTRRVYEKIDFDAAYPNALTARVVLGIRLPMILNSDKLAIQAALYVSRGNGAQNPRLVRISNSSHVDEIWISESLREEAEANPLLEIIGEPEEFPFDAEGNLL